jgi:hypothetical protein
MSSFVQSNDALNPFESSVVRDPKECGGSAPSLNKQVVERVVKRFRLLTSDNLPKGMRRPAAQLVLSPSAGFGKSHLIGRLYRELGNAATIVHQTPFQAPSLVWQTVLNNTINELCSVDESEPAASRWKIELFANSMVCRSVAELIRNGRLKFQRAPEVLSMLEGAKVSLSGERDDPIGDVVRERFFDVFRPLSGDELFGIRETRAWLTSFFHLATVGRHDEAFRASVAWLRYEPLILKSQKASDSGRRRSRALRMWLRSTRNAGFACWDFAFGHRRSGHSSSASTRLRITPIERNWRPASGR